MTTFLQQVSEYIYNHHRNNLGDICIVLPNRRAKLYLQKHLASLITKTTWLPEIFSIEDFIIKLSGFTIADNISLIFELYNTHNSISTAGKDSFDEFLNWAEILLHDFNETDLYLVKPNDLFTFLNDEKNIAHWNPGKSELTENQKKYLQFFSSLLSYYNQFTAGLLKNKQVYNGLAYRHVAENIESIINSLSWQKTYFAGLNALTIAEEKIIKGFIKNDKAELLWDADKYYMDNSYQESGISLRHYKSTWNLKEFNWLGDNFKNKKTINIIGVPGHIGQVKYAGQLLSDISNADDSGINNTAVVLSDENLLLPVLNSIPENILRFNVTMGLPMKYIPLYDLFTSIINLHENAAKLNKTDTKGNPCFYYKDILKFLEHPYIVRYLDSGMSNDFNGISNRLSSSHQIFFSYEDLKEYFNNAQSQTHEIILSSFVNFHNKPTEILVYLNKLIEFLVKANFEKQTPDKELVNEYLYTFSGIIKNLQTLFREDLSLKSLHILFTRIVASSTLPFYGEPLEGLQIMGVLETRTLDFENLIMLSVNENLIPSAKTNNSFIPFDIRKKFNLPTYRDRDAIFAYHFYRLLQRAVNIYLLYNTENDEFGKGEKSRFITQLINELPAYCPDIIINKKIFSIPLSPDDIIKPIIIEKSDKIMNRLKEIAENGFSPTSLNSFRKCPLQFYFSEVKRLKEVEETEETIEAATLGTVIHDVLQQLYKPFTDKQITETDIQQMLPQVTSLTEKSFIKYYTDGDITSGKNLLIVKVANKFITNFLKSEITFINKNPSPIIIRSLEHKMSSVLNIQNLPFSITVKGFIDRIDSIGNTTRIIDYKTGYVTQSLELTIKDWDDLQKEAGLDKSFQLLVYSWLYAKNQDSATAGARLQRVPSEIISGIISFRQLSKGLQQVTFPDKSTAITTEIIETTENVLSNILSDIYNPDKAFVQTADRKTCVNCPYKDICIR